MKSLFPILGLSFLSLTLTNCSLSPEKIASRLEPSIVKIKNTSGHGTGFFVLWVKYSNGKFGFSVQKQIYQSLGTTKVEYDQKVWVAFRDQVGWRKSKVDWSYDGKGFENYTGHLPAWRPFGETAVVDFRAGRYYYCGLVGATLLSRGDL